MQCQNGPSLVVLFLCYNFLIVSFGEVFREILEKKASAHPFENVQSLLPPNSWLGLYPVPGKSNMMDESKI